jgi:hypothetical protein
MNGVSARTGGVLTTSKAKIPLNRLVHRRQQRLTPMHATEDDCCRVEALRNASGLAASVVLKAV